MSLQWEFLGDFDALQSNGGIEDGIIWALVATDIGYLCEESAEEFCWRANKLHLFKEDIKVEDIKHHFGLRANVITETRTTWAIRCFNPRFVAGGDKKWVKKVNALAYSKENTAKSEQLHEEARKRKEAKEAVV